MKFENVLKAFMKTLAAFALLFSITSEAQLSMHSGRFQLVQLSNFRRDQFMIDTQTGKVWSNGCLATDGDNCQYGAFTAMDVEGITLPLKAMMEKSSKIQKMIQDEKAAKTP